MAAIDLKRYAMNSADQVIAKVPAAQSRSEPRCVRYARKRIRFFGGLVIVTALMAIQPSRAEVSDIERQILSKLDISRASHEIDTLSTAIVNNQSGAGAGSATGGTADEAKIAAFVEKEFEAIGLTVHTEPFPVRHFEYGPVKLEVAGTYIPAISYAHGGGTWGTKDGVPYANGNGDGGHAVRAPLVYVGAGFDADFRRAGDVRGKVVLAAISGRPATQILAAAHSGAAALITFVESTDTAKMNPDAIAQETVGYHDQIPAVIVSETNGKMLRQRATGTGASVTLENRIDSSDGNSTNVIATIKGSDFPDEWIMVSAHYDRWWQSANDNEAGVASMLEVARAIAAGYHPKRSVMFIATGSEESGLFDSQYDYLSGSAAFIEAHPDVMRHLVYDRNFDLAGWTSSKGQMLSSPEIVSAQERAIRDLGLGDRVTMLYGQDIGSDAWCFGAVGGGATSLLVYASRMLEYHSDWDPVVEPDPFWRYSHTQLDLYRPEYYKNLEDELRISTLSVLRMDESLNVPLEFSDVASWAEANLKADASKVQGVAFTEALRGLKAFTAAARQVDAQRATIHTPESAAPINLWLLRSRHELMPWLYAQGESSFRTGDLASELAAIQRARAAVIKGNREAAIKELAEEPLLIPMAQSAAEVEDQIRVDFLTSKNVGQRFHQYIRPASAELVAAYRALSRPGSPRRALPLLGRAEQTLSAELETELSIVAMKLTDAASALTHRPQ